MSQVFCVTAVHNDRPIASFVLADDRDQAVSKCGAELPEGGRVTHCVAVSRATASDFVRNKLIHALPVPDAIRFTTKAILDLIRIQAAQIETLQESVALLIHAAKQRTPINEKDFPNDDQLRIPPFSDN